MNRTLYVAGWSYLALCGLVLAGARHQQASVPAPARPMPTTPYGGPAGVWFAQMKPFCNAVEVEVRHQQFPPPATSEGAGFSAACYALAGKIDQARAVIEALPRDARAGAAGIVFQVGHPVADAGDDRSAGPIMRLVVEYQPENYMALYHAGMSEHILGEHDYARTHLERFLELYRQEDGWRGSALAALREMESPAGR